MPKLIQWVEKIKDEHKKVCNLDSMHEINFSLFGKSRSYLLEITDRFKYKTALVQQYINCHLCRV